MPPPMYHITKKPLHDVMGFKKDMNGIITMDVRLQWYGDGYSETMVGYVNGIRTINGGTHIDGVKASLTRTLNSLAKKSKIIKDKDITLSWEHVRQGLTCFVSIIVPYPEFQGQIHKKRFKNPYVRELVDKSVQEYLTEYFELHPDVFKSIISKCLTSYKAASAFERVMESTRLKSVPKPSPIFEKPNNLSSEKTDIVIGRGDSSRDAAIHGLYPCVQTKRTREQPRTDGAVSTSLGKSLENPSTNNDSTKRQKLESYVPSSNHRYPLRQTVAASNPPDAKDVSVKTLNNVAPGSNKTRKDVLVGPSFQAELPVWIAPTKKGKFYGSPGDSDTLKWLGTGVWPTYSLKKTVHYKKVGEGRPDSCSCATPRSTTCIKRHIKEARELLEKELKREFYTMEFDGIGEEEVSKSWIDIDEEKFKAFVKDNPLSSTEGFWKLATNAFPKKTEKDLRSYYYNVFLNNRARLLAKSSLEGFDSDDDHWP